MAVKAIVGLGNPGKKYEETRHNIGFLVVDRLLKHLNVRVPFRGGIGPFQVVQFSFGSCEIAVVKPAVFMNESGRALASALQQFSLFSQDCLVVADDVNLPLGKIRFRAKGSAGGHRGLESIIYSIGTMEFPRLRVGIGTVNLSGQDISNYVLGPFSDAERKVILGQIEQAAEACLEWVKTGSEAVMRQFN